MQSDLGGGPHFFGNRERLLKQMMQMGTQAAGLLGLSGGQFHLPQNLWLAQHHGVQTTGHPKGMTDCLVIGKLINVRAEIGLSRPGLPCQPVHRGALRLG